MPPDTLYFCHPLQHVFNNNLIVFLWYKLLAGVSCFFHAIICAIVTGAVISICRLLNGNQLNGSLPEEIGFLPNLDRIQIDQNQISGPIPKSFANLNKTKHLWVYYALHACYVLAKDRYPEFLIPFQFRSSHMNNNSLSGQIPPELSRLPSLVHL